MDIGTFVLTYIALFVFMLKGVGKEAQFELLCAELTYVLAYLFGVHHVLCKSVTQIYCVCTFLTSLRNQVLLLVRVKVHKSTHKHVCLKCQSVCFTLLIRD